MSSLRRLNPTVKLISVTLAIFHVALLQNAYVTLSHVAFSLLLVFASRPRINRAVVFGIASTIVGYTWVTYTLYVLNLKLDPHTALAKTLLLSSRIVVIVLYSIFFATTTKPRDLATSLTMQLRVPYEYAFMTFVTLRMFPLIKRDLENVLAFRKVKGYVRLSKPWTAIFSVVTPLLFTVVRRAVLMGISMEARGFGKFPERTFVSETRVAPRDVLFLLLFLLLVACTTILSYSIGAPIGLSL